MPAIVVEISDAVVDALNAASLGLAFTAERSYLPVSDINQLAALKVSVVPSLLAVAAFDMGPRHSFDWQVGIWLQKRANPTPDEIDPLMELAESIVELFATRPLAGTRARCIAVEQPIFPAGPLDATRVFTTSILLTFRLTR